MNDFLYFDELLSSEELMIRDSVKRWVDATVIPQIAQAYEQAVFPSQPQVMTKGLCRKIERTWYNIRSNNHGDRFVINFKGRHFKDTIILMSVRWYLAYSLSYRDIEELLAERGIRIDHSTVNRWVIYYSPRLEANFSKQHKRRIGSSWRMDETYIKVKGKWCYLYRAVDKAGDTIDSMLSKTRDEIAAKRFFEKAIGYSETPEKVTIDKSGSNNAALKSVNKRLPENDKIEIRQIKYLNNIVEQDHRFIKRVTKPMMGFKSFHSACATIIGIELHHMLRKDQHIDAANIPVFEQFYGLVA